MMLISIYSDNTLEKFELSDSMIEIIEKLVDEATKLDIVKEAIEKQGLYMEPEVEISIINGILIRFWLDPRPQVKYDRFFGTKLWVDGERIPVNIDLHTF